MKVIPIAFAFDQNLLLPASVCISSLLEHANDNTFYDIYILHPKEINMSGSMLSHLRGRFNRFSLSYIGVDSTFTNSYEIRGITTPTYYRLLIPDLLPHIDKIFYSDVDIIFRSDLSNVFDIDLSNNYLAATYDLGMTLTKEGKKHIESIGLKDRTKYIQAGFLLINSKLIRDNSLVNRFVLLSKNKYKYQDQDILNIVCENRYTLFPIMYNMTDYVFMFLYQQHEYFHDMSDAEVANALEYGTLHYNGHKPWKKYSLNFDIWWEAFRKSPVYNDKYYYDFFYSKKDLFDRLSLIKRIKILLRYFVYGRLK